MAVVHSTSKDNEDTKSAGVSFDYTWNSRMWQPKEGVVDALAPSSLQK